MTRPAHYKEYENIPEIVPGVFVEPGQGVYIVDDEGEVTCWVESEWDDPTAVTACIIACILATKYGANAVRRNIASQGETLESLLDQTFEETC